MSANRLGRDAEWPDPKIRAVLQEHLTRGAQRELLRVLSAPPETRSEVIRRFFERPEGNGMGEVLIDLEEDDFVRGLHRDVAAVGA